LLLTNEQFGPRSCSSTLDVTTSSQTADATPGPICSVQSSSICQHQQQMTQRISDISSTGDKYRKLNTSENRLPVSISVRYCDYTDTQFAYDKIYSIACKPAMLSVKLSFFFAKHTQIDSTNNIKRMKLLYLKLVQQR